MGSVHVNLWPHAGPTHRAGARRTHRGNLLVITPALVLMLMSMAVLAVDWGRMQVVRGELQAAADAAALFAAAGPVDASALDRATLSLAENNANGSPANLANTSVELGIWNLKSATFTAAANSANAVRVSVRATVPLFFGGLAGRPEANVVASAVALCGLGEGYGVVGIDRVRLNSFGMVDAYDSSAGSYAATRGHGGDIASNGLIELTSNARLYGDAWHLESNPVVASGSTIVPPGMTRVLTEPLDFPEPSLPASYVDRGSFTQNGGTLTLSAGNYLYKDLVITAEAALVVNGEVTIYVSSKLEIHSHSSGTGHVPSNLRIVGLKGADIIVNSHSGLAADIYAPSGKVTINSHATLFGRVVGREVLINSDANVHFDRSMGAMFDNTSRLVQ